MGSYALYQLFISFARIYLLKQKIREPAADSNIGSQILKWITYERYRSIKSLKRCRGLYLHLRSQQHGALG